MPTQLENSQISISEWCSTIFQKAWDGRYKEERKKLGHIPIYLYNPTWTFDWAEEYHKKACATIRCDKKFMDSITEPYGIKWELADKGFFKFFREGEE